MRPVPFSRVGCAARSIALQYLSRPQLRDAGDEMVLETAVNGRADALVTFNIQDFKPAASRFDIQLLTPAQWLAAWRPS